jgi:hypothetical protein
MTTPRVLDENHHSRGQGCYPWLTSRAPSMCRAPSDEAEHPIATCGLKSKTRYRLVKAVNLSDQYDPPQKTATTARRQRIGALVDAPSVDARHARREPGSHKTAIFFEPFGASLGKFNVRIPSSYFALTFASDTAAGSAKLR